MDKAKIKKERKRLYKEIDALNLRANQGDDVAAELLALGNKLDNLSSKPKNIKEKSKSSNKFTAKEKNAAAANGISLSLLNQRVHVLGWDLEEAITKPVQKLKASVEVAGLTVDLYQSLKAKRIRDKDIARDFAISETSLARFKKQNNLNHKLDLNPRNSRVRKIGETYRPPVTVLQEANGVPTRMLINGVEYFMVLRNDKNSSHFNNARSRRKYKRKKMHQNLNRQQAEGVKN